MPRPCQTVHPDPAAQPGCRLCFLYRTRPDYRTLWDGLPPCNGLTAADIKTMLTRFRVPADEGDDPPPCVHRGPRVNVAGSNRDWHACAKGIDQGAGPGVVCPCKGCGPKCPSYSPAADA